MSFKEDRELCLVAMPLQDAIYKQVWPRHDIIKRFRYEDQDPLDMYHHIDAILSSSSWQGPITLQEKALRAKEVKYNTITMELMQDRERDVKGEYFHALPQFYFSGYVNEALDGWLKWIIIDLGAFNSIPLCSLPYQIKPTNGSNANFICWNYDDIPKSCIKASCGI